MVPQLKSPKLGTLQALERAPPPKVEELHSSLAKGVDSFAKEAEKLSPFTMIGEQTKARAAMVCMMLQLQSALISSNERLWLPMVSAEPGEGSAEGQLAADSDWLLRGVPILHAVPPRNRGGEEENQAQEVRA